VSAPACPVCGAPLTIPVTGRRPRYCGKACRQAAYRARRAAERAAERAGWLRRELAGGGAATTLERDFSQAANALLGALADLAGGPPAPGAVVLPGGWSGWEEHVAGAARQVARLAHRAADLAQAHARAAAEFETAQQVLCRGGRGRPGGDETPAGSVPPRAARDRATKPAGPAAAAVDRDALFDAVEDVVYRLDRARLYLLPDGVADTLEGPAAGLAEVFAGQAGDGPLGELTAAAAAVLAAARGCAGLPADVAGALAELAAVLPAAVGAA
jgi:hypothetical protein